MSRSTKKGPFVHPSLMQKVFSMQGAALLEFMPQPSARIVWKVIKSAAANAENNFDLNPDGLRVKSAVAGDARTLKRYRARSRGRMAPVLKRYSHITVVVEGDEF